jgi:GntR family transcriptional regulator / MocR family aminotransferase
LSEIGREPAQLDVRRVPGEDVDRERSIGLYGMSGYRSSGATCSPALVLGFGNLSKSSIERGIERVGDLLRGR